MGTNQALRPDLICNPNLARGEQTVEKFFKTECLALADAHAVSEHPADR